MHKDQQRRISGDLNPFALKEAHYVDAIFFVNKNTSKLKAKGKRESMVKPSTSSQVQKPIPRLKHKHVLCQHKHVIFKKKVLEPLRDLMMPLSSIAIQEVDELLIMVNRPSDRLQKATLFYGILDSAYPQVEHLPDPGQDEEAESSYVLDIRWKTKLIYLLRKAKMEVDDEGQLPPTLPIFEKLWAPSEIHRFYDERTLRVWGIPQNLLILRNRG